MQSHRRMLHSVCEDARFGLRLLARTPGFTGAALVTLALGIGANSALLSFVDAIFLRPLAVPEATRLVHVYQTRDGSGAYPLSLPDYFHYRQHARSFAEIAAHYPTAPLHVIAGRDAMPAGGSVVTASYFRVLNLQPFLGRFFADAEDEVRDRDAVAVVSHAFWQRRLGGHRDIAGRTISINGRAFTIIGVTPPGFGGVLQGLGISEVWIPSAMFRVGYRYCDAFARDCTVVQILARLAAGVALEDARAELDVLARQLADAYPATHKGLGVVAAAALGTSPAGQAANRPTTSLLLAGVILLLLVACANVGGLLLLRGLKRRREIAIRMALGASRYRVVRQLLTEAALLALAGGALGLLVATWANDTLRVFYATDYAGRPLEFNLGIRGWILAVTAGLSLLTAILCGLAPALVASAHRVADALKTGGGAGTGRRSATRDGLVVLQIACCMMLLVGAGLLVRSIRDISRGPGIDASRIIMLRLRPSLVAYDGAKARAFHREVIRRLERIPDVEAASPGESLPLFGSGGRMSVSRGEQATSQRESLHVVGSRVGDRYFEVLGLPLLQGREFDSRDVDGGRPVAIVNEVLARQLWPDQWAAGRTLNINGRAHEVVGVVRAAQYHTVTEPPAPYVYLNYWQQDAAGGWPADSRTHIRVRSGAASMMPAIRQEIAAIDPAVPLSEDYPVQTRVALEFSRVRMTMTMLVSLGLMALVLSATGLYAVVAFAASLRTREIAIRMALGARPGEMRGLVIGHGIKVATLGAAVGLAGAAAGARMLSSMLYGVRPHDAGTFAGAAAVLVAVALVASGIPAIRAMGVDPALTLRQE